ncbi:L-ascorbate metabolism protein UlaG (beta-lactamase superfamily) [Aquimarina sp. MAR_2010_214]|uniref:MBL fold metallo-hydrolase n=1 Tax=Aquimarina sp. MAR_2010_214 TaxID=1250026 RepID=UPI000C7043D9|nr:MBL fold metallo-hydrolase [Aquimarina sp. MAR_2010_214]PKV50400.1 L-ascorbate metabolism protein UlaG (beta-lactamase superfamily) [Aquimarina sp. MAR_2010_214]
MLKIFFFFTSFLYCISGISQENITLTYTGNMGVLISDHQSSVLIDGLHTKYGDDYLFPSEKVVHKINTQLQPNIILFTHYHGDHFSVPLSREYLVLNKKAVLFGANQITKNFSEFKDRVYTITTKDYTKKTIDIGKIKVTGLKINHAGKRHIEVENVGYIIEINNKKFLHVGDTNWLEEIGLFDQLKLLKENIDIAILPYWMLLQDDALILIKKYINPKTVIATHISPKIKEKELLDLKSRYPEIHFLTTLEQQIQL